MNDTLIVTIFVVIADVLRMWESEDHPQAHWTDAEVLTVGIVAALYFQNHHERAVVVMHQMGYMSRRLSVSRFNRRLHGLRPWLEALLTLLNELAQTDHLFLIDSLPIPVCRRVRARPMSQGQGQSLLWTLCGEK